MSDAQAAEEHLFKRGLSDPQVQCALEGFRTYVTEHVTDPNSEQAWWEGFEAFFLDLTRTLSSKQMVAAEVAADSTLVHSGIQPWSLARAALAVAREKPGIARAC
jgi:hypothetical protein